MNDMAHTPNLSFVSFNSAHGAFIIEKDTGATICDFYYMLKEGARPSYYAFPNADIYGPMFAAAPETAAERDTLKELNAELLETLKRIQNEMRQLPDKHSDLQWAIEYSRKVTARAESKS